jgi:hypothetical protein
LLFGGVLNARILLTTVRAILERLPFFEDEFISTTRCTLSMPGGWHRQAGVIRERDVSILSPNAGRQSTLHAISRNGYRE